ncbi:MAG TPA: LysE family translocator [Methanocella sp.]|nr:LysE family translocator [Methanocella sp.]
MVLIDFYSILAGIVLGLSLGVPPGPVNAAIAAESARRSYASGIFLGLGAITCDLSYLALTMIGVSVLLTGATARTIISIAGGLILLYLGVMTIKSYSRSPENRETTKAGNPYLKGMALAATNPMGIVWWATAGASFVAMFNTLGVVGFVLGLLSWVSVFSIAIHYAKSRVSQLYPVVMIASGVCLLAFSVLLLYDVIRPVLSV